MQCCFAEHFVYKIDSKTLPRPPDSRWLTTPTPPTAVSTAGGCREKEFRCVNGRCVPAGLLGVVCDGVNDCGDGSDEVHCGELPPTHLRSTSSFPLSCGVREPTCLTFPHHRHAAVPHSHQSTQLPSWAVFLPPTRGLHRCRAALRWDSPLPERGRRKRLPPL